MFIGVVGSFQQFAQRGAELAVLKAAARLASARKRPRTPSFSI
jgi:hypothetical protein